MRIAVTKELSGFIAARIAGFAVEAHEQVRGNARTCCGEVSRTRHAVRPKVSRRARLEVETFGRRKWYSRVTVPQRVLPSFMFMR